MLCNKCNERHATVHLTRIEGDKMVKQDLCAVCGREFIEFAGSTAGGQHRIPAIDEPDKILDAVAAQDSRYTKAAYVFVHEGMLMAKAKRYGSTCEPGHISAAELLDSLRDLALETFGPHAKARLNGLGIFRCEDFGEIVFNLVAAGLLVTQEEDSRTDFQNGHDFDTAFPS